MESLQQTINEMQRMMQEMNNEMSKLRSGEGTNNGNHNHGGSNGNHNGSQYGRLTKVEFPRFEVDDVQGWLYRVNKFFEMDHIDDDGQKIQLVSMHVFGKALNWHKQFMQKFGEVMTWGVYQTHVKKRFESIFEDSMIELKNLKQTTTVHVYQDCFESLLTKVELPKKYTINLFIGGLKEEIAYAVRMFQPITLIDAFCLSKLQETNNSMSRNRSAPLLSNPRNNVNYGYANKYGGNGVRTTNVSPANALPVTTHVMPNRPFKRLTQKELDEKRTKGQCFYCDKKYFPGHKCEAKMFSLEVSGMEEEEEQECLEEKNSPDMNEYVLPEEIP
jgi:hypothetical protein